MLLPLIIAGLAAGAVYGLAGAGLVLTYKTSGIFNFAYGALATIGTFVLYYISVKHGVPEWLGALLCVFVGGPIMGVLFELLARNITNKSLLLQVVSTVGVLIIVEAVIVLIYGEVYDNTIPPLLGHHSVRLGSTYVSFDQIAVFAVAIVATAGLSAFIRLARLGIAMRAVVADPDLLGLSATSPLATRRWAWIIGATFAAASGVLIAPGISLDPTSLTFLVIDAFGAAALGAFTSLPLTFAGGLTIGVGSSLCTHNFQGGLAAGIAPSLPFLVLFATLLFFPRRWLVTTPSLLTQRGSSWSAPWPVQSVMAIVTLVFLGLVPSFAGVHIIDWITALSMVIFFLSLGLLVRTSGQVSLCQIGFAAIGAAAFSHLALSWHMPWVLALLGAGVVAVPIGLLLAIPAIRLSGIYLALATLGFGVLLNYMFYTSRWMFGSNNQPTEMPRPGVSWLSSDRGFYYLTLVITVLVAMSVLAISRSRLGRLLRGVAQSPTALTTSGASLGTTRVLVFALSAFLAGIAGALNGMAIGSVTQTNYPPLLSLTCFVLIVVVIGDAPWYALMAAGGFVLIPSYFPSQKVGTWLQLLFGVFAIATAVTPERYTAVPVGFRRRLDQMVRSTHAASRPARTARERVRPDQTLVDPSVDLRITELTVAFGGLVAVDGVSLRARAGKITGLIGPNGAGKTTTFNVCSGLNNPTRGTVLLNGRDLSRRSPAQRARMGLGRTFQIVELCESISVRENVAYGREAALPGANPFRYLVGRRGERKGVLAAADEAMARCGLTELADTPAGRLSTGERRRVELARAMAGRYEMLLLDEPSSGLDRAETEQFGALLKQLVLDSGVGVLIVEHDMALVSQICDDIVVLDFGKRLFSGSPSEAFASAAVQAAYLGGSASAAPFATLDGGAS